MTQLAKLTPLAELIHKALEVEQQAQAASLFLRLRPADRADVYEILNEEDRSKLLHQLDIPAIADLFDELEDQETAEAAEFISLEQLVKKGYLTSSLTEPLPERGGRSRRIYACTPAGQKALDEIKQLELEMWESAAETNGG